MAERHGLIGRGGLEGSETDTARKGEPQREPTRRLFFALWPDEPQQAALDHATRRAVKACGGRPVPARNFHLTLAFLGSVPERRIPELASIAHGVADALAPRSMPLRLSFEHVEYWKRPQILCATATEDSTPIGDPIASSGFMDVARLADVLKRDLVAAGFTPDLKPFHAHVTLARKVRRGGRELGMPAVPWSFTGFALIDSRTETGGALYSIVDSWILGRLQKS